MKMEREYNWKAILFGAVPVSVVMAFVFLSNISKGLKWFFLIGSMAAAMGITSYFDNKKHNLFTSAFVVVIATLIVYGLNNLGII
jgi:hypothetical protein